ncbi:MAG: hypothetical protein EAZ89_08740 [Bacteroidetes bacterium]|nr:MAG: hypothetical protein EAZ89_08740 [Bacteroidota bacterium]
MASGKMSPRQKMINMMYLVLLALLAMNVSAEILNAFEIIAKKLNASANQALNTTETQIKGMKKKIDDEITNEGNKKNEGLKDTLDRIKAETSATVSLLDKHIAALRDSISGVDPETGQLLKKDETEKNHQYFIGKGAEEDANGGRGSGEAFKLHQSLDKYVKFLSDIYNSQVKEASQKLKLEDEYITKDPSTAITHEGEAKTWERYVFEGPLVANIAMLESMKADVYEKEKRALDLLNQRLGVIDFKFDKVIAIDAPISGIVPAGLQFQTRLFVAASSSSIQPRFSSGSGSIKQEEGGMATLTIGASGGVIPQGKLEGTQSYSASIQVPKATGGVETLNVEGKFTVRKPEIVITSAAVQVLYRNCANDVNIDVPALGDFYNPVVTGSGAEIIKSQESKKKFRIVPTGKSCVVTVNSNTNGQNIKIGDVDYKVIEPPKPSVNMAVNGQTYNGSKMVPKTSRVNVRLEPDADFKANMPLDAKYGISGVDVLAQLSLGPPTKVNSVAGGEASTASGIAVTLGTQVRDSRSGTKVYIRMNEIYRVNFKGARIPDTRFSEVERTLSLVVE